MNTPTQQLASTVVYLKIESAGSAGMSLPSLIQKESFFSTNDLEFRIHLKYKQEVSVATTGTYHTKKRITTPYFSLWTNPLKQPFLRFYYPGPEKKRNVQTCLCSTQLVQTSVKKTRLKFLATITSRLYSNNVHS